MAGGPRPRPFLGLRVLDPGLGMCRTIDWGVVLRKPHCSEAVGKQSVPGGMSPGVFIPNPNLTLILSQCSLDPKRGWSTMFAEFNFRSESCRFRRYNIFSERFPPPRKRRLFIAKFCPSLVKCPPRDGNGLGYRSPPLKWHVIVGAVLTWS